MSLPTTTITLPGGLAVGHGTPYRLEEVDGWDEWVAEAEQSQRQDGWGSRAGEDRVQPGRLVVEGSCWAADRDALADAFRRIVPAPGSVALSDVTVTMGGRTLRARVRARRRRVDARAGQWGTGRFGWVIELVRPDPRLYGPEQSRPTGLPTAVSSGHGFNHAFPLGFGGTTGVGGEVTVVNGGTVPTPCVVEIAGPVTDPVVTVVATQARIGARLTVPAGSVLRIDTDARTVTLNGEDRLGAVIDFDLGYAFPDLPPGSSVLRFDAAAYSAGAVMTVRWADAYA